MQLIEIDPIGLQALERRVARLDDVAAAQTACVRVFLILRKKRFRRENDVGAATLAERLADELLARAGGVGIRRIDEVDSVIERVLDDGDGVLLVGAAAEHHRAQAQRAHLHTSTPEVPVFHAITSVDRPGATADGSAGDAASTSL